MPPKPWHMAQRTIPQNWWMLEPQLDDTATINCDGFGQVLAPSSCNLASTIDPLRRLYSNPQGHFLQRRCTFMNPTLPLQTFPSEGVLLELVDPMIGGQTPHHSPQSYTPLALRPMPVFFFCQLLGPRSVPSAFL